MIRRMLGVVAAGMLALNGSYMLFDPAGWYHAVPGVVHTGPLNAHFVRDIGAAYLASGVGIGLALWRAAWLVPGMSVPLVFLGLHAVLHLLETGHGHGTTAETTPGDLLGIYAPPLVLVYFLLRGRKGGEPT